MSMGCVQVGDDHLSFGRLMSLAKPLPRQDLELIREHTAPLWEEVRGSRIFLTGGTGFFGCWLVESFCFVNNLLGPGAVATIAFHFLQASSGARLISGIPTSVTFQGSATLWWTSMERFCMSKVTSDI